MGDFRQAIADYNQTLRIHPRKIDAYINRGLIYCKLGNYAEAIEDQNKALKLNPNLANIYHIRAETYRNLGNLKATLYDLQKAAEIYQKQGKQEEYEKLRTMIDDINSSFKS